MALFLVAVFSVGVLSGATASILGFGIGSMLTPLLTASLGASLAVAAVSLPHAVATAVRCWRLRKHIAFDVLKRFGLLSAAGGLAGALLYTQLGPSVLGRVLGALLLMTAMAQWTGMAKRWRPAASKCCDCPTRCRPSFAPGSIASIGTRGTCSVSPR